MKKVIATTEVGKLIRETRIDKKISQAKLAKEMGFSAAFLNQIEMGAAPLPPKHFVMLVSVLKVDINNLMDAMRFDGGNKLEAKSKKTI